jgi:C4-dicarboxylate-specific signal transduction histidine kinase
VTGSDVIAPSWPTHFIPARAQQPDNAGLNPAHGDQLFEPFFTTKAGGLGVGLTVSRLILESHGGRLWATGNVPRGAIFQFMLPCDKGAGL